MTDWKNDPGGVPDHILHDYVDEDLSAEDIQELEAALKRDEVLRGRLDSITRTVSALRSLPSEMSPPQSVWAEIEKRTKAEDSPESEAPSQTASVVSIQDARRSRTFSFSVPQLAAAALVLVVGSALLTKVIVNPDDGASLVAGPSVEEGLAPDARLVGFGPAPAPGEAAAFDSEDLFQQFEATAAQLETVVSEGERLLDPSTVEVIRSSLDTIDQAIAEARQALEQDPGSESLNRWLMNTMQKKVDLLTEVAHQIQSVA